MLVGELQNLRWDVICFSEMRAASADVILDGGHRLITDNAVGGELKRQRVHHEPLVGNIGRRLRVDAGFASIFERDGYCIGKVRWANAALQNSNKGTANMRVQFQDQIRDSLAGPMRPSGTSRSTRHKPYSKSRARADARKRKSK